LQEAVKIKAGSALAREELARTYEAARNWPGAVDQYQALSRLVPHNPEFAYQLGKAYLQMASWCSQQIMRVNPHSARVYEILAENYRVQGQPTLAVQALQRAAHIDPHQPGIHLLIAQIYFQQGKMGEARSEVKQELALVPESAAAQALENRLQNAR
jgi:Flp pilus assembly protein TadD